MKSIAISFAIGAALASSVHSTFSATNAEIARLASQSAKLQEKQKDIAQYFYVSANAAKKYGSELNSVTAQIVNVNRNMISASWSQFGKSLTGFKGGLLNVATVGAAAYGMILSPAIDFESIMSKVGAITNANAGEMAKLSAKARELGASTKFTATQAGEAMTYLGMAGWKTDQILAGMPGLLSLAAAGGTDLARAADIVSDDLTAFGLDANQAGHMADVFATVITRTNTNVEMLGETMKYAAPVAKAFGASMEETSALAGLMANSGIKASQAGTALRAGFLRLAGPPKKAAKEMAELGVDLSEVSKEHMEAEAALDSLGIKMSDTSGPRKMSSIIRELAEKTQDLGQEEKLAVLQAVFGTNAASGWLAVIDQGPDKLDELTEALENSDGAADKMAQRMQDNAQGSLTAMKSALESVAISVGSAFLPQIKSGAKSVSEMSASFARWAEENPNTIAQLGELTAGLAGIYLGIKASMVLSSAYNAVKTTAIAINTAYTAIINAQTLATGRLTMFQKIATIAQWAWNAALTANPIGAAIVAGMAFVGVLKFLYDNCTDLKIAWDNWWNGMKNSYPVITSILEGIVKWLLTPYRLIFAIVDKVKELAGFGGGDAPVSTAEGMQAIRENAAGGIYGRGAFLTTFAEDSGESAIPHTPTARNIGLLAKTNEIMGSPLGGNSYSIPINITVNGSADSGAASNIAAEVEAAVRRAIANIENQKARVSYA